jgi:pyruvate dehydrogenase complex dehydrogenase (E1) component
VLDDPGGAPAVTVAAMGATVPEALAATDRLAGLGHAADVVCVTSPGLLFAAVQAVATARAGCSMRRSPPGARRRW